MFFLQEPRPQRARVCFGRGGYNKGDDDDDDKNDDNDGRMLGFSNAAENSQ